MSKLRLVKLYRTVRETVEIAVEVDDDFEDTRFLWLKKEQREQLEDHAADVGSWEGVHIDEDTVAHVVDFQPIETTGMPVCRLDVPLDIDQLMKRRQQLCGELYQAGLQRNPVAVKLLDQIKEVDQKLPVPDFDLPVDVPQAGDLVYLPFHCSIDHGFDDVWGGVGTVQEVKEGISGGEPALFVSAHEQPGHSYNWEFLGPEQPEHKQRCAKWARPDPDLETY